MGISSFHPNGKPYQVKGAGSFFLKNNHIFKSPQEVIELLKQDWQIEIKSMREHFVWQKSPQIPTTVSLFSQLIRETSFLPSREPPGNLNNLSKIVNY